MLTIKVTYRRQTMEVQDSELVLSLLNKKLLVLLIAYISPQNYFGAYVRPP